LLSKSGTCQTMVRHVCNRSNISRGLVWLMGSLFHDLLGSLGDWVPDFFSTLSNILNLCIVGSPRNGVSDRCSSSTCVGRSSKVSFTYLVLVTF
jgi:hypothetical protein